jgi:hypothetical protein
MEDVVLVLVLVKAGFSMGIRGGYSGGGDDSLAVKFTLRWHRRGVRLRAICGVWLHVENSAAPT